MSLGGVSDNFLAARAAGGDEVAFGELVRRYRPLVLSATAKSFPGVDREELRQEALVGLLAACRACRADGAPFAAYASRQVRWRVARACETALRHKRRVLAEAIHDGPGVLEQVIARLPASASSDPVWVVVELRERLRERAERERDRRAIRYGYSREQIERAVGMIAAGATVKEVTLAIGAPNTTILRWVKRAGVTRTAGSRRFTADEVERALTLLEEGATQREAGAAVGATPAAVMEWSRRTGRRGRRRREFAPAEVRKALDLVRTGTSPKEAATAIGASAATVRRWRREAA